MKKHKHAYTALRVYNPKKYDVYNMICIHCGLPKETIIDWEKKFDEEFNNIYYGKDDDGIPIFPPEGFIEDVKKFINKLLR